MSDLVLPRADRAVALLRDALLIVGGSLLVGLSAKIQWPTAPVPITMQPFAVLLVGAALGARRGGLALMVYLLEGASGLPVFAGPVAGPASFVGPTAGYLLAFPVAAAVVGALAERGWDRRMGTAVAALAVGQGIIFAGGFARLAELIGARAAWATGVAPFMVVDALKILLAAGALPAAWRLLGRDRR